MADSSSDFSPSSDSGISRRGFLCMIGGAALGTFAIPELPGGSAATSISTTRTLLTIPIRKVSKKGMVQFTWTERTEEGVRMMTWFPSTPAELAEANKFYESAHQVPPESLIDRMVDRVGDIFATSKRSPEEVALLEGILSAPGESGPLLQYADWLTAQGNPQGEFIRIDCTLETMSPDDPASPELNGRWSELYEQLGHELIKPLGRLGIVPTLFGNVLPSLYIENGLVRTIEIESPKILPRKAKQLFDAAPLLRELTLLGEIDLEGIADCPQMAQIESLQLSQCEATDEGLSAIFASPHFRSLNDLSLASLPLSDELVEKLARSPIAGRLKRLDLDGCELTPEALESLVNSRGLKSLEELGLGGNRVDDAGLALLAGCTNLRNVRRLDLTENRLTGEGIASLTQAAFFQTLEVLRLSRSRIDGAALAPFRQVPAASLRELILGAAEDGDGLLDVLADLPWLSGITRLDLSLCSPLTLAGIRRLVESPFPGDLAVLDLAYSQPGTEGVRLLTRCPRLTKLRELRLSSCELTADCVGHLVEAVFADTIEELDLQHNPIGDDGAMALSNARRLRRLKNLSLTEDDLSEESRRALVERFGDALSM